MTDYEILRQAQTLITRALAEEEIFGAGNGANFVVMDSAKRLVEDYATACADGTINNEPV